MQLQIDEEAVRKVVNGFQETWNRHDMNALGALFTQDADFVNIFGTHWKGRESIQLNTHSFTARFRQTRRVSAFLNRLRHLQDKQRNSQTGRCSFSE